MQVTVEQREPCTKTLNIEVDAAQVADTVRAVYKELGRNTEVPGFRKGKAPLNILERYISPESVNRRVMDRIVSSAYAQAIKEHDITPYAYPDFEVLDFSPGKPFVFKATVPLAPEIELGDYKGIEVTRPMVSVTEEDVDAQIEYLRQQNAVSERVDDRGVQDGDFVVAEISTTVEGQAKSEPRRSILQVGQNLPEFDAAILGMERGQQRIFTVTYPVDFADEELAGKNAEFEVKIESVRVRRVPELNDEFASRMGFDTVPEMREHIRKRLADARNEEADEAVNRQIVDEIVSRSKVLYPSALVDHEVQHDLEEIGARLEQAKMTMEDHLRQAGITEEELLKRLQEAASRRLTAGLVLGKIAEREKLSVTDAEIDEEVRRIAEKSEASAEDVEAYLEGRGGREGLRNSMMNQRIFEFLKSVSHIKSAESATEST